jgi:trehalose synthase-fused probable maltokinase
MNLDLEKLKQELPRRRWYGDKARHISHLEIRDAGTVDDHGEEALVIAIIEVHFESGDASLYNMLLLVVEDGSSREATEEPERLRVVGELLAHGSPIKGEDGGVFHFSGPSLNPSDPPGGSSISTLGAEQSNTSVVFDQGVILKLFRKIEPGVNPDLELTRLLTNQGFQSIPTQLGEIFYEREEEEDGVYIDLGLAQTFVSDAKEGWKYGLEHLESLYEEIHPQDAAEDRPVLVEERSGDLLAAVEQLGEATAALHVELSREDLETEMLSEPIEHEDLKTWSISAIERLNGLLGEVTELDPFAEGMAERLRRLTQMVDAGHKIRVHGDYHLGQVLRVPRGWRILDFEGEPARTLEERRAKHSPVKDVAGMLRSFSYLGTASLFERSQPEDDEWNRLEPWALMWERLARERFLSAYLAGAHEGHFLPPDREELAVLLDFFELDKALYEVDYERGHRPPWLRIPLRGIKQVIERGERS